MKLTDFRDAILHEMIYSYSQLKKNNPYEKCQFLIDYRSKPKNASDECGEVLKIGRNKICSLCPNRYHSKR